MTVSGAADPWRDSWLARVFIISGTSLPCSFSGVLIPSPGLSRFASLLFLAAETLLSEDASALPMSWIRICVARALRLSNSLLSES